MDGRDILSPEETNMRNPFLAVLAGLAACNGDKTSESGDTGGGDTTDTTDTTDTLDTTDTTDTTGGGGFNVEGIVVDAATQAPGGEGLCAALVDPTPALGGGEPLTLSTTTIGAGGAFTFTEVSTTSAVGILVDVRDCASEGTVYPSATGIPASAYQGLGDGDTLPGITAFSIDATLAAGVAASATGAGYTGDILADGMMFGFVLDSGGAPISGATVECVGGACNPTYYMDTNPKDGLFTGGEGLNASTDAAAGAVFVIGAAPIGNYHADDGGAHTFTDQLNGSNPGIATITAFYGE